MEFCLTDVVTYNKLYAKDNHKYIPIKTVEDLEGFPNIGVRIHEYDALSEEQEVLQKQLEALAFFGAIFITYVDEEGNENVMYNKAHKVTGDSKKIEIEYDALPYTQEQIQDLLDREEDGCSSGACAI